MEKKPIINLREYQYTIYKNSNSMLPAFVSEHKYYPIKINERNFIKNVYTMYHYISLSIQNDHLFQNMLSISTAQSANVVIY